MILNVLISCYNDSVSDVPKIFLPPRDEVRYIVSHQMSTDFAAAHPELTADIASSFGQRADVVYSPFVGKGVSQNRNHCLDALRRFLETESSSSEATYREGIGCDVLKEQLCVLSDDDVSYTDGQLTRIIEIFREHPSTDAICFRIATPEGQPPFKSYPAREYEVEKVPVYGKVYFSEVEIAFRYEPVFRNRIRFDENFGLGSSVWPEGGEGPVFLSDCRRAGMRLDYVPEYLVQHPFQSTGKSRRTVRKAMMLEAVAVRCRGKLSFAAFAGRLRVLYRRLLYAFHLL